VGVPLHPSNDPKLTFSGAMQLQRPGLLLVHGWVYAAFGGHCDHQPYACYVDGMNVATHARTMWSDEAGLTDNQAGIWQSGGGLLSDGTGRLFFTSGNVPVGKQATVTLTVTNTGNEPATMTGSSTLTAPYHAVTKVTPQLPVNAGDNLKIPVTFTPTRKGNFTATYQVTWTDVVGKHAVTVHIKGKGT